ACGGGMAALMFGVVEYLPYGWRALYAFGLVPLLLIAYWRRTLPETARYEEVRLRRASSPGLVVPLGSFVALLRSYPVRFCALLGAGFIVSMAISAAGFFTPKYLQDVHQWSPGNVALMTFFGGMFAILGNPMAGWLSDTVGRRPVAIGASLLVPLLAIVFYTVGGWWLPLFWMLLLFVEFALAVTFAAFGAEFFPTAHRSTAAGARTIASTLGGVAGLAAISGLFDVLGDNWSAIRALAAVCFLVPLIVYLFFPETARRELDDIAPDMTAPPPK
ncbi:MAG: MHS family MFS transporter, partial [Gammaproteobacteria bacterium]|nr:MHS family MFS transporter [Gammaproteobacteria bacterium]